MFDLRFLRNRSVVLQLLALFALTCAFCAGVYAICRDARLVAIFAAFGASAIALVVVFAYARYREIARLSFEIDEVLHHGRAVDFSTCREGDVEVLRNEISKMTAALSRTADQLQDEKRLLADAMADISHQIRTPITALCCALPAIEHADDPVLRKRLTREVDTSLNRVAWLVSSLLRMAKIDAGALTVERASVSACAVVDRVRRSLGLAFELRDVDLLVDVPSGIVFEGDERWCAEALENIVKNCMEHTPAGGRVEVLVRDDALSCKFIVRDGGPGIDPEDLPHLFERFYRGSHSSVVREGACATDFCDRPTFETEGFGIGLALAQSLASVQGGAIRARNRDGGGAEFEMAFFKINI